MMLPTGCHTKRRVPSFGKGWPLKLMELGQQDTGRENIFLDPTSYNTKKINSNLIIGVNQTIKPLEGNKSEYVQDLSQTKTTYM